MNDDKKRAGPRGLKGPKRDARPGARPARDDAPAEAAGTERIAKRLARAGVASRREAESLIAAGRVRVNGHVLDSPALNVGRGDTIEIDGQPIPVIERTRLFLFHKPAGTVTTNHDPEGKRTIFDILPEGLPRLMTVGRLDMSTEGLLLLTNDGGLARVLELPATGWLRRYRVRVHGTVDEKALAELRNGIAVDGIFYGAVEATLDRVQGTNAWLMVGVREGKNREVRNILGALGLEVNRLIRVSYGPFQLGELAEGEVQELRGRTLRDQLGERLIEEAGADFEAPVVTQFSNKPERAERAGAGAPRKAGLGAEGEGGLIKGRRGKPADRREAARDRLSTSAHSGFGERNFGGRAKDARGAKAGPEKKAPEKKVYEPTRARSANVWIGPGARPTAPRAETAEDAGNKPRARGPRAADPNQRMRARPGTEGKPHRDFGDERRPGRGDSAGDERRPARKTRPAGAEDGGARKPPRDWKANPPRPGKAERASAKETGVPAPKHYEPRRRDEGADGDKRRRPEGERKPWSDRPSRAAGQGGKPRGERPWKGRDGAAPAADGERKPRSPRPDFGGKGDKAGRPARAPYRGKSEGAGGPRRDGPARGGPRKGGPRKPSGG